MDALRGVYVFHRELPAVKSAPRGENGVEFIVLHATEGAAAGAISWFFNPQSGVSAHYLVERTGDVVALVSPIRAAYHVRGDEELVRAYYEEVGIAGEPYVPPNFLSVGIELENEDSASQGYTTGQYLAAARVVYSVAQWARVELFDARGTWRRRVVAHSELQRDRSDPGPHWSWGQFVNILRDLWQRERMEVAYATAFDEKMAYEGAMEKVIGAWRGGSWEELNEMLAGLERVLWDVRKAHGIRPSEQ